MQGQVLFDGKLCLFDLDGTLIKSEDVHERAQHLLFQKLSIPVDLRTDFRGRNDQYVYDYYKGKMPVSAEEYKRLKNQEVKEQFRLAQKNAESTSLLTHGVLDFMKLLKSKNIRMAVVSASEEEIVKFCFELFGFDQYCQLYFSVQETHFPKPSPSPYFKAMRFFRMATHQTIIFEDSFSGTESAITSGAQVIRIKQHLPQHEANLHIPGALNIDHFLPFLTGTPN